LEGVGAGAASDSEAEDEISKVRNSCHGDELTEFLFFPLLVAIDLGLSFRISEGFDFFNINFLIFFSLYRLSFLIGLWGKEMQKHSKVQ
jgi:hypothetical protein